MSLFKFLKRNVKAPEVLPLVIPVCIAPVLAFVFGSRILHFDTDLLLRGSTPRFEEKRTHRNLVESSASRYAPECAEDYAKAKPSEARIAGQA
mmetsp:Transcript_434/g.526  ORF Transcript_434/g.526 Transcript_434/m.526 type:complete len:93 (-) Transcript_434:51-329(-)